MSAQDIFDTVADHLLTQNQKAIDKAGKICAYRGKNGTKCALGCLISDDEYSPSLEGHSFLAVKSSFPARLHAHGDLITALQNVHDFYHTSNWRIELFEVAKSFKLDSSVLLKYPDAATA